MKAGRTRTLRGTISHEAGNFKRQLILDDGRPNSGLKILEFHVWANTQHQQAYCSMGLAMDVVNTSNNDRLFLASDARQIAWANWGFANSGTAGPAILPSFNLVDPNHIINRDLYLFGYGSHEPVLWNYLIVCQEYELTDDEAIITIVKETSQNAPADDVIPNPPPVE